MSELFLVRHAQASFGTANYDQLSDLGHEQSRLLGKYFYSRGVRFDQLMTGEMYRHRQTLDGICEELDSASKLRYVKHAGLNEYNFEAMISVYQHLYPDDERVQALAESPVDKKLYYQLLRRVLTAWSENRLPDLAENWPAFRQRVLDVQAGLRGIGQSGQCILAISSGGPISFFMGSVLGLTPEKVFDLNLQIKNTSVSHFYFNRKGIELTMFNGLPHLEHPELTCFTTYG